MGLLLKFWDEPFILSIPFEVFCLTSHLPCSNKSPALDVKSHSFLVPAVRKLLQKGLVGSGNGSRVGAKGSLGAQPRCHPCALLPPAQ